MYKNNLKKKIQPPPWSSHVHTVIDDLHSRNYRRPIIFVLLYYLPSFQLQIVCKKIPLLTQTSYLPDGSYTLHILPVRFSYKNNLPCGDRFLERLRSRYCGSPFINRGYNNRFVHAIKWQNNNKLYLTDRRSIA